jgi:hypothetical protein
MSWPEAVFIYKFNSWISTEYIHLQIQFMNLYRTVTHFLHKYARMYYYAYTFIHTYMITRKIYRHVCSMKKIQRNTYACMYVHSRIVLNIYIYIYIYINIHIYMVFNVWGQWYVMLYVILSVPTKNWLTIHQQSGAEPNSRGLN